MDIIVKNIEPQHVRLVAPNNTGSWIVNEYELLDARVQIKQNKLTGYTVIFGEDTIKIDHNGTFEYEPEGFFDTFSNLLLELL